LQRHGLLDHAPPELRSCGNILLLLGEMSL